MTAITYSLSEESYINLSVYDMTGRLIKTLLSESSQQGINEIQWDGTDSYGKSVGAGVYLYHLRTDSFTQVRKMLLLK